MSASQGQAEQRPERQGEFDSSIRIDSLPTPFLPFLARLMKPLLKGGRRKKQRDIPAIDQGTVVFKPISHSVLFLKRALIPGSSHRVTILISQLLRIIGNTTELATRSDDSCNKAPQV